MVWIEFELREVFTTGRIIRWGSDVEGLERVEEELEKSFYRR